MHSKAPPRLRNYVSVFVFVFTVTFPCAILYRVIGNVGPLTDRHASSPAGGHGHKHNVPALLEALDLESNEDRLERVLKKAAMVDKTVILTILNSAWIAPASLSDLFFKSFHVGERTRRLLDHVVVIALDRKAYTHCLSIHPHCLALTSKGIDFAKEQVYMSDRYMEMNWGRLNFLCTVLEKGYDFIFTDADVMWLRDPLPNFDEDADIQFSSDLYYDPVHLNNSPNAGFKYVRSNERTIKFYKLWYSSRKDHPNRNEQDVLNIIRTSNYPNKIGLKIRYLDTQIFGGLCWPYQDLSSVCTMHANCCKGLDNKTHDLTILLEDWKILMSTPPSVKYCHTAASWSVPQKCEKIVFN